MDGVKLEEAAELRARSVGAEGARELVIIHHGRLIWKGDDIDRQHGVWSATKSFTSTVLGGSEFRLQAVVGWMATSGRAA